MEKTEKASFGLRDDVRRPVPNGFFSEEASTETDKQHPRPASVTIGKPLEEVWAFTRDLTNMPKFARHVKSVTMLSPKLSHWVFEKDGKTYERDSETIAEEIGRLIAWRSVGDKPQTGVVTFERAAGGRGTVVSMRTTSDREPGKVGGAISYYTGWDPKSESFINLRRLKAYMETGEVPTTEGQPNGRDEDENLKKQ